MLLVKTAKASMDISFSFLNLYNEISALRISINDCACDTVPAIVAPILSSIWNNLSAFLFATKLPIVALVSVAKTTPSVHTKPTVVVPSIFSV